MKKRQVLAFGAVGAASLLAGNVVAQPAWPGARPIRLIVGYPPGGGIDFAARTIVSFPSTCHF